MQVYQNSILFMSSSRIVASTGSSFYITFLCKITFTDSSFSSVSSTKCYVYSELTSYARKAIGAGFRYNPIANDLYF